MLNNQIATTAPEIAEGHYMTLKEITDLLDVRHNDSMKTVERMAQDSAFGTLRKIRTVYNERGQSTETYQLDKRQSLAVSARLNVTLQMRVIDRWMELEAQQRKPKTRLELAHEQVRLIEELETKEAEVKALRIELDDSQEWATIKRVEMLTGKRYDWRALKAKSSELGIEPRSVFDVNYGTVNSYHGDVWLNVYGIYLDGLSQPSAIEIKTRQTQK
ncbi:MAG: Uncharacterised protein [Marinobacterium sp. xm-d-530]|jgi:hypothetical protein|nr:MAG: Uncharacterised protein [Marinobacterium sp. xm-d-530]